MLSDAVTCAAVPCHWIIEQHTQARETVCTHKLEEQCHKKQFGKLRVVLTEMSVVSSMIRLHNSSLPFAVLG